MSKTRTIFEARVSRVYLDRDGYTNEGAYYGRQPLRDLYRVRARARVEGERRWAYDAAFYVHTVTRKGALWCYEKSGRRKGLEKLAERLAAR